MRIDRKKRLKYSSLQGEFAQKKIATLTGTSGESIIFFSNGEYYEKSEAIIKILLMIGGAYKITAYLLSIFPFNFLNIFYDALAKRRYTLFGKKETCRLPDEHEKNLFL